MFRPETQDGGCASICIVSSLQERLTLGCDWVGDSVTERQLSAGMEEVSG